MGYDIADIDGKASDVDIKALGGQKWEVGTIAAKAAEFARQMIINVQDFLRDGNEDMFMVRYIELVTGLRNSQQVADMKAKFEVEEGTKFPVNGVVY